MPTHNRSSTSPIGKPVSSRSLFRGIAVLEAVAKATGQIGVTEVATVTDLDKGTASRLLAVLRDLGYVRQRQVDRQYELGGRCLWLAQRYSDSREELASRAMPHMAALRDITNETVHLAVREGRSIVAVAQEEPDREVRVKSVIGTRLPIEQTATGRAILAMLSDSESEAILREIREEAKVRGTTFEVEEIEVNIAEARRRGWAAVDLHDDVFRIASAILDTQHRPIGAISLSGPLYRTKDRVEEFGSEVAEVAKQISSSIAGNKVQ